MGNFDPGVEVDASVRADVGIVHGREGVRDTIARWVGAWDDWREEIEEIRDLGSRVLACSTQHGRSKGTGIEVETRYVVLYEVHGGKTSAWPFTTRPPKPSKPWGCGSR